MGSYAIVDVTSSAVIIAPPTGTVIFFTTFADVDLYRKPFSLKIMGAKPRLLKKIVLELVGLFCQTMNVRDCFPPLGR